MNKQLNILVDEHGLFAVLDALSGICGQKSEQLDNEDWVVAEAALDAAASVVLDLFSADNK